jgi:hypothetical protein
MPKQESLADLRERLRLEKAITAELEKQARLRRELARPVPRPKAKPKKPVKKVREPRKVKKPGKKAKAKALHPRAKTTGQYRKARYVPGHKWRMTLRPTVKAGTGRGKQGSWASYIVVLILERRPDSLTSQQRGEIIRLIRVELQQTDPTVKWLMDFDEWGAWNGPEREGDWWTEQVRSKE